MIRELSLGLLINSDVPFSFFSDPFFEQLTWQLDPHLSGQVPWSRQSMSRLLDDTYKSKKDQVKQELSDALTKIHLGFDLWTSPKDVLNSTFFNILNGLTINVNSTSINIDLGLRNVQSIWSCYGLNGLKIVDLGSKKVWAISRRPSGLDPFTPERPTFPETLILTEFKLGHHRWIKLPKHAP
jgi:hypothetical protein